MNHENIIRLRKVALPPADGGGALRFGRRKYSHHPALHPTAEIPDPHPATQTAPPASEIDLPGDDVLSARLFIRQLQREKRRADRSGLALTVAIFWVNTSSGRDRDSEQRLLDLLRVGMRETDIVGHLGGGRLGIILTDTGQQGGSAFCRKISELSAGWPIESTARTYPDDLFQDFHVERRPAPEADPLQLDPSVHAGRFPAFAKRCLDLAGASLAVVLFSPIMLATAVAIFLTSPGPVIFKQTRLGRAGVPFVFYKFRSMRANADDRIHREYVTSIIKKSEQTPGEGTKAWSKLEHDPRITPIGRFIRKTSIDELPQLFNVLQGHLSLVGPRPPLPYEAAEYASWHLRRVLEVKPGITGLWQVAGRGATTFEDMVRLDLQYIRDWSIASDIRILLKTVVVVLRRRGAR